MLGAATALAAFGIGAIMQNGGTESFEVPATYSEFATQIREGATVQSSAAQGTAVEVPATRSEFATQIREGAAVQPSAPAVNQGPNFELPATWTEWSVVTAPAAVTGPTVNQGPNFELPATWTEWSVVTAPAAVTGPAIPTNVR